MSGTRAVQLGRGRIAIVAFAIVTSLLVVAAMPAAASHGLVVASQHTTDADFNNAQTLDNVTVSGSGDSASVELGGEFNLSRLAFDDSFDVSAQSEGLQDVEFNSDGTKMFVAGGFEEPIHQYSLSTPYDVTTASFDHSFSVISEESRPSGVAFDDDGSEMYIVGNQNDTVYQYSLSTNFDISTASLAESFDVSSETGGPDMIAFDADGGEMVIGSSADLYQYSLSTNFDISTASFDDSIELGEVGVRKGEFNSDGTTLFRIASSPKRIFQFSLSTPYDVTTASFENSIEVPSVEDDITGVAVNPDQSKIFVGMEGFSDGAVNQFSLQPQSPATYLSANHTASDVEQAWTDLSLSNTTATVTWEAWDGASSSWTTVASDTHTTSGNVTQDVSGTDYSTWRVNVTFDVTGADPNAELHDEGVLFEPGAPTLDESEIEPEDGAVINESGPTISIPVNDSDFATAQGDAVDVNISVGGSVIHSETITSNQTVSTTASGLDGGETTWSATAQDDHGETETAGPFTFQTPATLYVRNETDTSELVDAPTNVTVRFFADDEIVSKSTEDGTVNLTNLPVSDSFIVEVEASEHYHSRTIYLDDLYTQDTVYLLNQSHASVESRFSIDDPTGQFDSETLLYIQKPVNLNGTVKYRTIHADRFGVEGVTAILDEGARYRISIQSELGTEQDIGPYRADVGESVTVRPGSPTTDLGEYEAGWAANAELRNQTLEFVYADPDDETSSLTVFVHEKDNTSNQLGVNRTFTDLGNASGTYSLTANQSEQTWRVNFVADRGGEKLTRSTLVANSPTLVPGFDEKWQLIVGVGILIISAGIFSVLNAGVGAVIVAIEGGLLWWSGWLDGATTGVGVILALFVAVIYHVYSSSTP